MARDYKSWINIAISVLALGAATAAALFAYQGNTISKEALEAKSPYLEVYHYISDNLEIDNWFKYKYIERIMPDLQIASNKLYDSHKDKKGISTQAEKQSSFYLWLIIGNKGDAIAHCVELISIHYTVNNQSQNIFRESYNEDNRWPSLSEFIRPGDTFAILMRRTTNQSELESFKEFRVKIKFSRKWSDKSSETYEFKSKNLP